jgi:hypothetical protein
MLSTLRVLLYASNHDDARLAVVTGQLGRYGVPYTVLGAPPWRGFGQKLLAVAAATETLTEDVLLFCDGYDTLVLDGPEALLRRFKELGALWVSSAEPNIWPPDAHRPEEYPDHSTPWPYLNSGMYMAERAYARECFKLWRQELDLWDFTDDQAWLASCYLKHPDLMLLDTRCQLFQSLLGGWWAFEIQDGKLHNTAMDTYPLVVHHNGGGNLLTYERTWPLWKLGDDYAVGQHKWAW